jgi:DNA replication protein DnaC
MYRLDGSSFDDVREQVRKRAERERPQRNPVDAIGFNQMSAERVEYVRSQILQNRLRRQIGDTIAHGGNPEEVRKAREELERTSIANHLANLKFPKAVFDRWCNEQPPRASVDPGDLVWTCPTCGIMVMPAPCAHGFIRGNCQCQRKATDERLRKEAERRQEEERMKRIAEMLGKTSRFSWLGPQHKLDKNTFENFDLLRVAPKYRERVSAALDYAQAYVDCPIGNTVVYGPSGSGKTHLFTALLNAWCETGKTGLYANALDLFAVIDARRMDDENSMEVERKMQWCDLLIIDEIDRVKLTDARFGVYYRVLNYRSQKEMEAPGSAPTILICNATIENAYDLEQFIGTPAASRMQVGLNPVYVPGDDQRAQ